MNKPWLRWGGGLGLAGVVLFAGLWILFPFPRQELASYPAATILLDLDGVPLRMRLGPQDADCRLQYRPDVEKDWICKAIVATEDHRFWSHPGIDPLALARAIGQNIIGRRVVSGASTLSTQVIRLLQPRRRTLATKAIELFRALQMERILSKQGILEQYLNRAPFGANLIGVEAASRRYFGKEPGDLSLAEAALLAGMPQSPSRLRPDRYPGRARKRQAQVLDRMVALGMITRPQLADALSQPIVVKKDAYPFRAPHFCNLLLDEIMNGSVHMTTGRDSAVIQTTLSPALQRLAEETLRRHGAALRQDAIFGGAIVIIEVKTGAVRALVGAPDYRDDPHAGQVNGAAVSRSAGSTLKPFAYALALDQGRITPATMMADVPRTYRDYTPANFDGDFNGLVSARAALVMSLNIPALTLVEQEGVTGFLALLHRLGLGTLTKRAADYGLGLALGNGAVRLIDLANAYAGFARGGEWRPYRLCEGSGRSVSSRVFSPEAAWLVAEMLSGDERAGDTTGHHADVRLPRVAWKTGTSAGFRDAWVVAFNPEYVVGVWLGNPDGRGSPALVGAKAAVPVMWDIVRGLYPANDGPWFQRPPGVMKRAVCAVSGIPAGPHCSTTVDDWFIAGVSSATPCPVHRLREAEVVEVWPSEVEAFLRARAAPSAPGDASTGPETIRLISPVPGSHYRRLDDLAADQRLSLKAEWSGRVPLYWFVDNQLVATVTSPDIANWPLTRGPHLVVCCTAAGQSAKADIVVE
ncbi:MAG: penicillin-binding protein 1C [bacterium]